jgi:Tfp pilus assembly protein FimT
MYYLFFHPYKATHCTANKPRVVGNSSSGFGLVELLVSITIVTIIVGTIVMRQNSFNSAVLLRNQAYSIAMDIRDAQMSSISVSNEAGINNFRVPIGVYFSSHSLNNQKYQVFKDLNNNGRYDGTGEDFGPVRLLDPRFEISNISVGNRVDISFKRPNFDAIIEPSASNVEITVKQVGHTETRIIEVTSVGQITVK